LLRKTVGTVKQEVEGGSTLAAALAKHPKIFDDLYCNMVEAGEAGGILNTILNRIALFIEKANRIKKKVKGAMIYPCAIVGVAVIVVSVMMIFVIPVFAELYGSMGQALPAPTQICINISNWFVAYWYTLIIGGVGIVMGFSAYRKTPQGEMNIDRALLRMPIIGDLLRKLAVARFSQNMSLLLSSGVPILDGLAITARTAGNKVVEKAIMSSRVSISEGKTVAEPLRESKIFPPLVCSMVAVGESTGGLMEPMIMVVLGVVLGGLVVAMYLPIFQMGSLAGG
jgi:type IV pilus assembly protein PilC